MICIEEVKLSGRFVSGGERSDDTVSLLWFFVNGVGDAIVGVIVIVIVEVSEVRLTNNG